MYLHGLSAKFPPPYLLFPNDHFITAAYLIFLHFWVFIVSHQYRQVELRPKHHHHHQYVVHCKLSQITSSMRHSCTQHSIGRKEREEKNILSSSTRTRSTKIHLFFCSCALCRLYYLDLTFTPSSALFVVCIICIIFYIFLSFVTRNTYLCTIVFIPFCSYN